MQNNIIVPTLGIEPYNNFDIVITKKVSVKTEPHKWIVAPIGIAKFTISLSKASDLLAHCRATGKVAAEDIVPTAVRYAGP